MLQKVLLKKLIYLEGEGYNGIVSPIHQMDDEVPIQGGGDRQ